MRHSLRLLLLLPLFLTGCLKSIGLGPRIELTIRGISFNPRPGEQLDFYIGGRNDAPPSDKLLILVQGSGEGSMRERFGDAAEAVTLGYDIVYLEKYAWNDPITFRRTDARSRRLADIHAAVRHIVDNVYGGSVRTIGVIAEGEGGVIAPDLATLIPEMKWLVVLGAGGMSRAQELEILHHRNPSVDRSIEIGSLDALRAQFDRMRNDGSPDSMWRDHSWRYWQSYLDYAPAASVERLEIPTIFIMGERDQRVPIESLTALRDRMAGRESVTFHVVEGGDQNFNDPDGDNLLGPIIRNVIQPWYRDAVEPTLMK